MSETESFPFLPDWTSAPGDTIENCLEEKQISIEEFAALIKKPTDFVERLLVGNEVIDYSLAANLSSILGSTISFWLQRELHYREEKVRLGL